MFERILWVLSLGGWNRMMGTAYMLIGTFALLSLPDVIPKAQASEPCEPGFYDCGGTCVADDQICCPDGSSGSNQECYCCHGDDGDESLGTVTCGVPAGYEEEYDEWLNE
jgi:hypothetical protein